MDDVDRCPGGLRQADRPVGRLGLEDGLTRQPVPASKVWAATTSMAIPFSAWIMISPPFFADCCIARKIEPSSLRKTPG